MNHPEPEKVSPLIPGVDYVLENGLLVFTAHYLLKRGRCCSTGCRNCPYGFRKPQEQDPDPNLR